MLSTMSCGSFSSRTEMRPLTSRAAFSLIYAPPEGRNSWVKLKTEDAPAPPRIKLILTMFPGKQQMILYCEKEKKRIGAACLIHEGLVAELEERLGKENVVVK